MAAVAAALTPRLALTPSMASPLRWPTLWARALFGPAPLAPLAALALPGIRLRLPTLGDIWESVLRAVPKKKVSHSRRRHRQMAGKALEDVKGLCNCPGCGETKRTHRLCQRCLEDMRRIWRQDSPDYKPF